MTPDPLYTPRDAAQFLSIGLSYFYMLMRQGDIASIKVGKLRRISRSTLEAFVERRVRQSMQEGQMPEYARIAYEAWAAHQGWQDGDFLEIPRWDRLETTLRAAWGAAADAVLDAQLPGDAP